MTKNDMDERALHDAHAIPPKIEMLPGTNPARRWRVRPGIAKSHMPHGLCIEMYRQRRVDGETIITVCDENFRVWGILPEQVGDFEEVTTGGLSAIKPQSEGPEGYVLVPREPTEEMIREGDEVMHGRYGCSFEVSPIYRAMLSAASAVAASPPANGGDDDVRLLARVIAGLQMNLDELGEPSKDDLWKRGYIAATKAIIEDQRAILAEHSPTKEEARETVASPLGFVNVYRNDAGEIELGATDLDETPDEPAYAADYQEFVGKAAVYLVGTSPSPEARRDEVIEALEWAKDYALNECEGDHPLVRRIERALDALKRSPASTRSEDEIRKAVVGGAIKSLERAKRFLSPIASGEATGTSARENAYTVVININDAIAALSAADREGGR